MDAQFLSAAFKMTMALGFVLLTFGAAVMLARKFAGTSNSFWKRSPRSHMKPIEILAQQNLGPGKNVYLVRCLDKKILIGSTTHQINSLMEMTEQEDALEDVAEAKSATGFSKSLKEKMDSDNDNRRQFEGNLKEISRV